MTTIQERLFAQEARYYTYLVAQMETSESSLPWDLLDYITFNPADIYTEEVRCTCCKKVLYTHTVSKHQDYTTYGEQFCTPCYESQGQFF